MDRLILPVDASIVSVFQPLVPVFLLDSSARSGPPPQILRPEPVLGRFYEWNVSTLLKVKSRGHVYPLSYLPYF